MKKQQYVYKAVIVSMYDGDSITLNIDHGRRMWQLEVKCRLYGIDTPEIRGKERPEGLIAKKALMSRLEVNDIIIIETHKDRTGKYGRDLITIWLDDENINKWLVDNGYAEEKYY